MKRESHFFYSSNSSVVRFPSGTVNAKDDVDVDSGSSFNFFDAEADVDSDLTLNIFFDCDGDGATSPLFRASRKTLLYFMYNDPVAFFLPTAGM